jgi:hypothetical protein
VKHAEHAEFLSQQANLQKKAGGNQADELRKHSRRIGLKTEIDDTDDQEDEE